MKIRIEGCTQQELYDYSPYLSLGKVYEVNRAGNTTLAHGHSDTGEPLSVSLKSCAHLPGQARWVEVPE